MILHYSLAILNTNDNALSLLFFANAPMSGYNDTSTFIKWNICGFCIVTIFCRTAIVGKYFDM